MISAKIITRQSTPFSIWELRWRSGDKIKCLVESRPHFLILTIRLDLSQWRRPGGFTSIMYHIIVSTRQYQSTPKTSVLNLWAYEFLFSGAFTEPAPTIQSSIQKCNSAQIEYPKRNQRDKAEVRLKTCKRQEPRDNPWLWRHLKCHNRILRDEKGPSQFNWFLSFHTYGCICLACLCKLKTMARIGGIG